MEVVVVVVEAALSFDFESTKGVLVSDRPGLLLVVVVVVPCSWFSLVSLEIDDERILLEILKEERLNLEVVVEVEAAAPFDFGSTKGVLVSDRPGLLLVVVVILSTDSCLSSLVSLEIDDARISDLESTEEDLESDLRLFSILLR